MLLSLRKNDLKTNDRWGVSQVFENEALSDQELIDLNKTHYEETKNATQGIDAFTGPGAHLVKQQARDHASAMESKMNVVGVELESRGYTVDPKSGTVKKP